MGPPPFGSGNYHGEHPIPMRDRLQWGHRLSAVETRDTRPSPSHAGRASMGPPPFGSGNKVPTNGTVTSGIRLQWGHRLSAVETLECLAGELEGLMMLQWGHRLSAVETRRRIRGGPWIRLASMGPPPFGSGNSGRVVGICWTVFQLQWGHRLSAVETSLNIFFAHCGHANASMGPPPFGSGNNLPAISIAADLNRASMGPPPFGSGNAPCFSSILPRWYMLQWGHRLSAVETSNVAVMRRRPSSVLQWGHRLSAVETCRSWDGRGPGPIASMGPPPFGSGNAAHCSVSGLSGGASMGPPPFGSGNRRRWCHAVPCLHSFNGATAFRQWKRPNTLWLT